MTLTDCGTVNLTSPGQDEASWSEDQAAVTWAHTVNDRATSDDAPTGAGADPRETDSE